MSLGCFDLFLSLKASVFLCLRYLLLVRFERSSPFVKLAYLHILQAMCGREWHCKHQGNTHASCWGGQLPAESWGDLKG